MKKIKFCPIVLSAFCVLSFGLFSCSTYNDDNVKKIILFEPETEPKPDPEPEIEKDALVLSAAPGVYSSSFVLYITPKDSQNKIYYTTDGSEATVASSIYSSGIAVNQISAIIDSSKYSLTPNVKAYDGGRYNYGYLGKGLSLNLLETDSQGNEVARKTATYIVDNTLFASSLPVVCLSAKVETWLGSAPSYDGGLYNLRPDGDNDDKYRGYLEYFDTAKNESFGLNTQLKRGGNWTRNYPLRTINLNFKKDENGVKNPKVTADIFDGRKKGDFSGNIKGKLTRFRLHSGGNEVFNSLITDAFVHQCVYTYNLNAVNKLDVSTTAYRPCMLFLNAEYWGLYFLREHYSADYFEYNYGVNKDNILYVDKTYNGNPLDPLYSRYNFEAQEGTAEDNLTALDELYEALGYDYETGTITNAGDWENENSESYKKYCELVDIDSLIDLVLIHGFASDYDFMFNNFRMWRTLTAEEGNPYGDTKWRFMLHDVDMGFQDSSADNELTTGDGSWNWNTQSGTSYFDFYLGKASLKHGGIGYLPLYNHVMLSQPAKNPLFKARVLERAKLVEEAFNAERCGVLLDNMKNEIKPYSASRAKRWGVSDNLESALGQRKIKLTDRPKTFLLQVKSAFGITEE